MSECFDMMASVIRTLRFPVVFLVSFPFLAEPAAGLSFGVTLKKPSNLPCCF